MIYLFFILLWKTDNVPLSVLTVTKRMYIALMKDTDHLTVLAGPKVMR